MIPDRGFIWCHSFWRNDLAQPFFSTSPSVILFRSMRTKINLLFFSCHADGAVVGLRRNLDRGAVFFHKSAAETSFEGPLEPDAVRTAVGSRE